MTFKAVLVIIISFLLACGAKEKPPVSTEGVEDLRERVSAALPGIVSWLPYCKYSEDFKGVSKRGCVPEGDGHGDGDVMAYAGYLCMIGQEIGCETVRRSFSADGRAWRSPGRVNVDTVDSWSRDMLIGLMSYLVATKDVEIAKAWWAYVEANNGKICPDATDGRCDLTPNTRGLISDVWKYLGLPRTASMLNGAFWDDTFLKAQANLADTGYQLELVAIQIYIKQRLDGYNTILKEAAEALVRRQPNNPFFEFLYRGQTRRFYELWLSQMPTQAPEKQFQWSIARDTAEQAWKDSMGWEWLFLAGLAKIEVDLPE